MKENLKKLFISKSMLVTCSAVAIVFWVLWGAFCLIDGFNYALATDAVFYIAIIIGLLVSYDKGETNVQKVLLGSLFIFLCDSNLKVLWDFVGEKDVFRIVVHIITFVLSVVVFVSHITLQSDHVGAKRGNLFNQLCSLLLIVLAFYGVNQAFFVKEVSVLDMTFIPALVLTYLVIICIETRVQAYKKLRADAMAKNNWNEETRTKAKEIFKF